MVAQVGIEPTTPRSSGECSTTELPGPVTIVRRSDSGLQCSPMSPRTENLPRASRENPELFDVRDVQSAEAFLRLALEQNRYGVGALFELQRLLSQFESLDDIALVTSEQLGGCDRGTRLLQNVLVSCDPRPYGHAVAQECETTSQRQLFLEAIERLLAVQGRKTKAA